MDKACVICKNNGKYKCPTCLVYYCSVNCCKIHRENKCDVVLSHQIEANSSSNKMEQRYTSVDTVPFDKLQMLNTNNELKNLLVNPHLQNLLSTINNSDKPEEVMQKAMQEPLFVEFADECLKVVEPHAD